MDICEGQVRWFGTKSGNSAKTCGGKMFRATQFEIYDQRKSDLIGIFESCSKVYGNNECFSYLSQIVCNKLV